MNTMKTENLKELIEIIAKLRSPEGCPWDREQTHETLKRNMLEEAYETIDAIDEGDSENLKEELGDVLLQVIFHAQIAEEDGRFDIEDVAKGISEKLIRRHPHVFSDEKVKNSDEVIDNWEKIKLKEKPERKISALSGVSKAQPALMSALEISKKAVKVGFEWPNEDMLIDCINSEVKEFKETIEEKNSTRMEEEFGDLLFAMVNWSRWHKVNPEQALLKANKKFTRRFQKMEEISEKELQNCSFEELDELWKKAKKLCE